MSCKADVALWQTRGWGELAPTNDAKPNRMERSEVTAVPRVAAALRSA